MYERPLNPPEPTHDPFCDVHSDDAWTTRDEDDGLASWRADVASGAVDVRRRIETIDANLAVLCAERKLLMEKLSRLRASATSFAWPSGQAPAS